MVSYYTHNNDYHEVRVDHVGKKVEFTYPFQKRDWEIFIFSGSIAIVYIVLAGYLQIMFGGNGVDIIGGAIACSLVIGYILSNFTFPILLRTYHPDDGGVRSALDPRIWTEYKLTPKDMKSKVVEVNGKALGNVFTQYFTEGEFEDKLEMFEVLLEPFKETRRRFLLFGDKLVKNERWFFRITFSDIPKTGFIFIQNQKEFPNG